MDSLALLCNLYGDGPATLNRLRMAGRDSLESLLEISAQELASLLASSPAAARRFLREAHILRERIELEISQVESSDQDSQPSEDAEDGADGVDADRDPLIEEALEAWRSRDLEEQPTAWSTRTPGPGSEPMAPRDQGVPLAPRLLEGLDEGTCERLRRAGIGTIEALASADIDGTAHRASLPLTPLIHLQFLARRTRPRAERLRGSAEPDAHAVSAASLERSVNVTTPAIPAPTSSAGLPIPGPGAAAAVVQSVSAVAQGSPNPVEIVAAPIQAARDMEFGLPVFDPPKDTRFSPAERPAEAVLVGLESELARLAQVSQEEGQPSWRVSKPGVASPASPPPALPAGGAEEGTGGPFA